MENQYFFYHSNGIYRQIFPDEIVFLQTKNNHTVFFTDEGKRHTVRISLEDALRQLPEGLFFRINRSEAVAGVWIEKITNESIQTRTNPKYTLYFTKQYFSRLKKQLTLLHSPTKKTTKKKDPREEDEE